MLHRMALVVLKRGTRRNNTEDGILHRHRRGNLKSYNWTDDWTFSKPMSNLSGPTVSRPVYPSNRTPSGTRDQFLFLFYGNSLKTFAVSLLLSHHLWWEDGCAIFSVVTAQSLVYLIAIIYCLVWVNVKVKIILRPTVSCPVSPGIRAPSRIRDQFSFHVHGNYT
jgi:hypothetical protein